MSCADRVTRRVFRQCSVTPSSTRVNYSIRVAGAAFVTPPMLANMAALKDVPSDESKGTGP